MIRIYLCDDDQQVLSRYHGLIEETLKTQKLSADIKIFSNGEQLLFQALENPNEVNIIFLDIQMGKITGIDTAKQLRKAGCFAEIIYLTADREMVFDAFDTTPFHYLVKGEVTKERFVEVLLKAIDVVSKKDKDFFSCSRGAVKKKIPIYSISHFTIDGRIATVNYNAQSFDFYGRIEVLQNELQSKGFARCHRSVLVSLHFIDEIRKEEVVLINNTVLPLGATYVKDLKSAFSKYLSAAVS